MRTPPWASSLRETALEGPPSPRVEWAPTTASTPPPFRGKRDECTARRGPTRPPLGRRPYLKSADTDLRPWMRRMASARSGATDICSTFSLVRSWGVNGTVLHVTTSSSTLLVTRSDAGPEKRPWEPNANTRRAGTRKTKKGRGREELAPVSRWAPHEHCRRVGERTSVVLQRVGGGGQRARRVDHVVDNHHVAVVDRAHQVHAADLGELSWGIQGECDARTPRGATAPRAPRPDGTAA